jgi:hypothetical protein
MAMVEKKVRMVLDNLGFSSASQTGAGHLLGKTRRHRRLTERSSDSSVIH